MQAMTHPLRLYRERAGLSQSEIGVQLGVNKATVSRWESRSGFPSLSMAQRIEELTGAAVTVSELARLASEESS